MGNFKIDELAGAPVESVLEWARQNEAPVSALSEAEILVYFSTFDRVWTVWSEDGRPRIAMIKNAGDDDDAPTMNAKPCQSRASAYRFAKMLKTFEKLLDAYRSGVRH